MSNKQERAVILPVVAFLVFGLLALSARAVAPEALWNGLNGGDPPLFTPVWSALPTSLRVGSVWVVEAVDRLVRLLANLVMIGPQTAPLARPSPWNDYSTPLPVLSTYLPMVSYLLARFLLLLPVLVYAMRFHDKALVRTVLVIAILAAVGGWPPLYVNAFYTLMSSILDWPMAYYSFHIFLTNYDLASIGFVFLLAIYLVRHPDPPLWQVAALAAFGQLFYENLGLETGVAFFAAALIAGQKLRVAILRLVVAGLGSLAELAAMVLLMLAFDPGGLPSKAGEGGALASFAARFDTIWETVSSYNFLWLNVTLANIATVLALPAIAGAVLGLALARVPFSALDLRRHVEAGLAIGAGFLVSLGFAFFFSGLVEFGRQGISMAALMVPLAMAATLRALRRP